MGSITPYETAAGKRYRVRYAKPDHSTTQKRGFKTKHEAELYLASVTVSKARGEFVDPAASRVTIRELGRPWLEAQSHLKPSSFDALEIAWRLYVLPRWGTTSVSAIQHSDVQTWVSQLTRGTAKTGLKKDKPKSATVVIRAYGVLASLLDVAVRDRRIMANPARGVSLPRKLKKPHTYLSHERVDLLAESAGEHSTLIRFLAYTGLRWGEATGLRVRDLDTLRRRIGIRENAVRVRGYIVVGTPKTHANRTVPYPEFLTLPLAAACQGKPAEALLFGAGFTHLLTPSSGDGWYVAAIRRAREIDPDFPKLTIHDLRHTAASLAISAGANVKAVQRMLGHASAAMTLDVYADLFDDDLDAVAMALDAARLSSNVAKKWPNVANPDSNILEIPVNKGK